MRGAVDGREVLRDFGGFYARTYPMAYRTALGICREAAIAEEATQDAYVSAFRGRDRYRGDGHPDAWLLRIVVNSALSVLRRRSARRATALPDEADGSIADSPRLPDPVESMAIRQALDALDGRHRAAIVLRYYHDLDYATIARIMGTSAGNVGSMLSRGLARMRTELAEDEFDARAALAAPAGGGS